MIRFSCGTCGKPLRAPVTLAGKKGRCARCGAVNGVPVAVNVDVKRIDEAESPFRSTADVPVKRIIQATVEGIGGRFQADSPASTALAEPPPGDFFDQVASRMAPSTEPFAARESASAHPDHSDPSLNAPRRMPREGYGWQVASPSADLGRAIAGALVVGAVIGFCIGLLASKWVL